MHGSIKMSIKIKTDFMRTQNLHKYKEQRNFCANLLRKTKPPRNMSSEIAINRTFLIVDTLKMSVE